MEKIRRSALVVSLVRALQEHRSWCGETHIQKALYCLQVAKQVPTNFDFILYKHGPFSFDLRDVLTEMRANGLLDMHQNYPFGPSLFPSDKGKMLIERFPKTVGSYKRAIDQIAETFGSRGVAELERLSTALYVTKELVIESRDTEERAELLQKLKPHIPPAKAKEAVEEADTLLEETS